MTASVEKAVLERSGAVPLVRAANLTLPQVFGRYLLLQRLSRGGMGEIFLAKHGLAGFEKLCVIKKILPNLAEDAQFISRFVDEAKVAIQLQHANIAQVFEVGRVDDEYFLSIEYVEGRDLRRTLSLLKQQKQRFPLEHVLFIGREIANGLAYAHRRTDEAGHALDLVHCDISPPNVVVSFEGETKLIDFGIAKSTKRATATDPQMGFGKFGYMAPEQLIRGGVVDHRTDIYATGVVLYELMTGERLYEIGESPDYKALARAVARGDHPLPSHLDPLLAPYDELVSKALRPRQEDRYQTAAELRDAIQHALVAIHPTMSADHLGGFLRAMFADEMREERELAARARATDLRAWEDQLTTQSSTTVSYALAHMPLIAPDSNAVRRVSPAGSVETEVVRRLPLPAPEHTGVAPLRRSHRIVLAAAAGFALMGGVALALVMGGDDERTADAALSATPDRAADPARPAAEPPPPSGPVVASITPAPSTPAPSTPAPSTPVPSAVPDKGGAAEIAMPPELVDDKGAASSRPPGVKTAPGGKKPPKHGADKAAAKPELPGGEPAPTAADAEKAVLAKFSALSRDYRAFKQRFGARLEGEWADLATYAQFAKSAEKLEVLDKKIDRFRAEMKRAE